VPMQTISAALARATQSFDSLDLYLFPETFNSASRYRSPAGRERSGADRCFFWGVCARVFAERRPCGLPERRVQLADTALLAGDLLPRLWRESAVRLIARECWRLRSR